MHLAGRHPGEIEDGLHPVALEPLRQHPSHQTECCPFCCGHIFSQIWERAWWTGDMDVMSTTYTIGHHHAHIPQLYPECPAVVSSCSPATKAHMARTCDFFHGSIQLFTPSAGSMILADVCDHTFQQPSVGETHFQRGSVFGHHTQDYSSAALLVGDIDHSNNHLT